jgi:hypothetical protein
MSKKKKPVPVRATAGRGKELSARQTVSISAGVVLILIGLGIFCTEAGALFWRLKARLFYTQGVARVERTAIEKRDGAYEVDITYHLEAGGKSGEPITRQAVDDPWSPTPDDAAAKQRRYEPGKTYECWYSPQAPDQSNYLVPGGLRLWDQVARLWLPLVFILPGLVLCRWKWDGKKREAH